MKIKDTSVGLKGEAMRLMFNRENYLFFDEHMSTPTDTSQAAMKLLARLPEVYVGETWVTNYSLGMLVVGSQFHYVPQDPKEYYDATMFVRLTEKLQNPCLLFLLSSEAEEKQKLGAEVDAILADIMAEASRLLHLNGGQFLVGSGYTIADFALLGLFLALEAQALASSKVHSAASKYEGLQGYLDHHRQAFLPYLIKGGRYTTCYLPSPYTIVYRFMFSTKKVRLNLVESAIAKVTIAGLSYSDLPSVTEMIAKIFELIPTDHLFDVLHYRNMGTQLLCAPKPRTLAAYKEVFTTLNSYYEFANQTKTKEHKRQITVREIYVAAALEDWGKEAGVHEAMKKEYASLWSFYEDFTCRYKRAEHCVVLRADAKPEDTPDMKLLEIAQYIDLCRDELNEVMMNLGFKTVETQYPYLSSYQRSLGELLNRPECKENNMEIFAYLDGTEGVDKMIGYSGIKFLEEQNAPFAGAGSTFLGWTARKEIMKNIFIEKGIPTAAFVLLEKWDEDAVRRSGLTFPVLVKLHDGFASLGMTKNSKCFTIEELKTVVEERLAKFNNDPLLVESFVDGPEYSVLIIGNYDGAMQAYPAVRAFDETVPEADRWLSYELYWLCPARVYSFCKVKDAALEQELKALACKTYSVLQGVHYGRIDFRQDKNTKQLYVLEANSVCCVGYNSSSYFLLKENGLRLEDLFEDMFYHARKRRALPAPSA